MVLDCSKISPVMKNLQEALQFTLLEYLSHAESDTLENSSAIYSLALECPDEFGDAVYHARSLIRIDSLINNFDDDNVCNYVDQRTSLEDIIVCNVNPNPSNDKIQANFEGEVINIQVSSLSWQRFNVPVNFFEESISF